MQKTSGHTKRVFGIVFTLYVCILIFSGIRANRRKQQQEKLRMLEQIKVESAKRRTKSVVFAKENIRARSVIRKHQIEVKEVEERDLPKQEFAMALDEVICKIATVDIYMGEPLIYERYVRSSIPETLDSSIGLEAKNKLGTTENRAIYLKVSPYDQQGALLKGFKYYEIHCDIGGTKTQLLDKARVLWVERGTKANYASRFVALETSLKNCEKLLLAHSKHELIFKRRKD